MLIFLEGQLDNIAQDKSRLWFTYNPRRYTCKLLSEDFRLEVFVLVGKLFIFLSTTFRKMPLPAEVKGLIFDCDGTLLDTMPLHWKAWCAICKETGLKFDKESFFALAGVPGREIIRELANQQGISLDPLEVYAQKRAFFLKGLKSVKIIPCVVRFVLEARRLGIPTAVASGSSRTQVERALIEAGIRDLFDEIVGNEDYQNAKPHPEAFLTAAERLDVNPQDCWAFEDSDIGIEAIKRAGFAKFVDVRLLEGYPVEGRLESKG